ncbi:hypothetical protein VB776_23850 [Arcicella sp. DC2W]|uniref:Uncharacterized protein n=1 Tax=Arcicella gelida TaxID=2984195 RepID=A0ABU5SC22_9BACT|nr:hypothetical protein [Arcicella sp. DC2W]MEA5405994.1 hypothetical protein [Arcicella sp. DC2W]
MNLVRLDSTAQVITNLLSKNTPICFQESFKEVFNKAFHRLNLNNDKDWISKFKNKSLLFTTSIKWSISKGSINHIQNPDDIMTFKNADDILLNVVIVPENFLGRTF